MVLGVETSVSVRTCAANHMKSHVKYDLRKFGFTDRVVNTWNSLPNWVVSANTTNTFKTRLDKFWHSQDIIYNFRAQLQGTGSRSEFS